MVIFEDIFRVIPLKQFGHIYPMSFSEWTLTDENQYKFSNSQAWLDWVIIKELQITYKPEVSCKNKDIIERGFKFFLVKTTLK